MNWNDAQGLPRFAAICAFRDSTDTVWLGGYDEIGLYLYRIREGSIGHFTAEADGLASDHVLSVYEDRSGTIWIVGLRGLTRIQSGKIQTVKSDHELVRSAIHAIVEDDLGNLWFGSPNGIYCAAPEWD